MSKIEWCDITINPIVGCSKCGPGCANCYAEKFASRLAKNPRIASKYEGVVDEKGKWTGHLNFEGWTCLDNLPKYPKRVFLGSMTDTFHENMTVSAFDELMGYVEFVWPQHTFLLLTKRPANARAFASLRPLPKNVWLGVTVCNQREADIKIPILLEIPATKHFVSVEPMLDFINLFGWLAEKKLDWIICGGETGPDARPMHPAWARNLRDQCLSAQIPFFFKSFGEWSEDVDWMAYSPEPADKIFRDERGIPTTVYRIGKRRIDHRLDGVVYRQYPEAQNV